MRENILGFPALQIEPRPGWQELETGLRQLAAALAQKHRVEPLAQGVQMQYVGRRIGKLRVA